MPFKFEELSIPEVVAVTSELFPDERGNFLETFDKNAFHNNGLQFDPVLAFYSESSAKVLRGLHFQKEPYVQAKLVQCLDGKIFDVAVDLRKDSDTFGEYVGRTLSADNRDMLFVPRGFAHGFVVLGNQARVHYLLDNSYSPDHERGIKWDDKTVSVDWPIDFNPIVSERDASLPALRELKNQREELF